MAGLYVCLCACSVVSNFLQPHARHAPLSMGFSRQEYWSGLPFPHPGDLKRNSNKNCILDDTLKLLSLCYRCDNGFMVTLNKKEKKEFSYLKRYTTKYSQIKWLLEFTLK